MLLRHSARVGFLEKRRIDPTLFGLLVCEQLVADRRPQLPPHGRLRTDFEAKEQSGRFPVLARDGALVAESTCTLERQKLGQVLCQSTAERGLHLGTGSATVRKRCRATRT
jgi:hypothetical protein